MSSRWCALAAGALGLVTGLVAAVADLPWLGLVAGAAAAVAGLAAAATGSLAGEAVRADSVGGAPPAVPAPAAPAVMNRVEQPVGAPAPDPMAVRSAVGGAQPSASDVDPSRFVDPESGLFNESYFEVVVASRISAARRHLRPVSIVLLEVATSDSDPTPLAISDTARVIGRTIREADTACRLSMHRIGLVLEDTAEDGAVTVLDRFRAHLATFAPEAVCWAGIACYPTHVFHAEEARAKAARALRNARAWPQHRVEVASAD